MKRLAIISTHPIQYNAPFFRCLAEGGLIIKVFYTLGNTGGETYDKQFGKKIRWDIPLLEGYDYCFLENSSKAPGTHYFNGVKNPTIISEVSEWKPDAVLVNGWAFHSHLKAIRHFKNRVPVLFRGDSTLLDEPSSFSGKKILRRLFLSWLYRNIDFALYVGEANKKYFLKHGLKENQLVFVPHAVDNKRFSDEIDNPADKAMAWRSSMEIAKDKFVFLFAAKLIWQKNIPLLVDAFNSLEDSKFALLIVGNGELEFTVREKCKNNPNIFFMDFQNQSMMPILYRMGQVFILPSISETWGLAVNEALACGTPVIVSDKCGCSLDLIRSDENGYVFKSNDKDDLVKAMVAASENHNKLSRNASETMVEWSYETGRRNLIDLLHRNYN